MCIYSLIIVIGELKQQEEPIFLTDSNDAGLSEIGIENSEGQPELNIIVLVRVRTCQV